MLEVGTKYNAISYGMIMSLPIMRYKDLVSGEK
jgi:hypothetical protein